MAYRIRNLSQLSVALVAMKEHTGHLHWGIGGSKMQLKNVTIGSRGSKAAIGAGDAGAALNTGSRSTTDLTGSFFLTSGLALATFLHSDQQFTTRIVDVEEGPISMLKCSASGDIFATGIVRPHRTDCTGVSAMLRERVYR